jgi:hypothetical protein
MHGMAEVSEADWPLADALDGIDLVPKEALTRLMGIGQGIIDADHLLAMHQGVLALLRRLEFVRPRLEGAEILLYLDVTRSLLRHRSLMRQKPDYHRRTAGSLPADFGLGKANSAREPRMTAPLENCDCSA